MRKFKIIFYIVYFGFILTSIYFAMYTEVMFKQFGMFRFLKFLQYWAAFGMLLMLAEWLVENIHLFQIRRKNKKLEKEVMSLKSELYGMQKKVISDNEQALSANTATVPSTQPKSTDTDSGTKKDAE